MGENDLEAWPRLLSRTRGFKTHDCSLPGATVKSALMQANELPTQGGLVMLEIGGNDLLGPTTVAEFSQGLEQLLQNVSVTNRPVLMFELPLPPFHNEYGRVQRRLAAKYQVHLIPKRVFVSVLAADGATLDTIHLSKPGRERMAEAVWTIISPTYQGQTDKNKTP